jgi:hypothetical protein
MPDLWRRLRSRELGVKNTHLQFFYTLTNHSFNPVPIQAPYVWYPSRSIGYGVGVRAKQTVTGFLNEACGVRVELKVLPPERCSGQRGRDLWGFALTVSADVTKCGSGVKRRKSDLPNLASPLLPLQGNCFSSPPNVPTLNIALNHHRKSTRCIGRSQITLLGSVPIWPRHRLTLPYSCTGCTALRHLLHPPGHR